MAVGGRPNSASLMLQIPRDVTHVHPAASHRHHPPGYHDEGYTGVALAAGCVQLGQQADHADDAGAREDADADARLLADVALALRDVVAEGADASDADAGRQ